MLKSVTSSPQLQTVVKVAKDVGPTVIALGAAGAGLWYAGAVTPVLNYADSFLSPLIGSWAGNLYAQGAALVAEASLAVAALRTGTWTVGQVRKVKQLENENQELKEDIKEKDETILELQKEQNEDLAAREKELATKEKEFAARNKKLDTKEKGLLKREASLDSAKKEVRADKATLKREQAHHEKSIKLGQAKNHTAAKNIDLREKAMVNREKAVENMEAIELREKAIVDRERAVEDMRSDIKREKLLLAEGKKELALDKAEFERMKQQQTVKTVSAVGEIEVRPSILADFSRRKEQDKLQRSGAAITLPAVATANEEGELSASSSHDEKSSSSNRRSPSPSRVH